MVNIISSLINEKLEINFINEFRKGKVLDTVANINKTKSILYWEPQIDLLKGLKQMIHE